MSEGRANKVTSRVTTTNSSRKQAVRSKTSPTADTNVESSVKGKRTSGKTARRSADEPIGAPSDWRVETLAEVRRLIHEADPEIVEEQKWIKPTNPHGVPVWSHAGIVCTGEMYQQVVKLTFARGASLEDSQRLFNSSLTGNRRRAIDLREGDVLNAEAFKSLIQAAVAANTKSHAAKAQSPSKGSTKPGASPAKPVKLLSGGNPQIAKADGNDSVQAYIAAMPGWKREIGQRLDALIEKAVPDVLKAVRWNSPFYGTELHGWFLSIHVFNRYVKVTFLNGKMLDPVPPGGTVKSQQARWIDIPEGQLNEKQITAWIKQAAGLPGWHFGRKS